MNVIASEFESNILYIRILTHLLGQKAEFVHYIYTYHIFRLAYRTIKIKYFHSISVQRLGFLVSVAAGLLVANTPNHGSRLDKLLLLTLFPRKL